jgi:prevent-host-death family protein
MPVADIKRDFRHVLDAAERGEETVVLRRGKPVAVVAPVPMRDSGALPEPLRPGGLLSILGLFDTWETMEEDIAAVIDARAETQDRPPPNLD